MTAKSRNPFFIGAIGAAAIGLAALTGCGGSPDQGDGVANAMMSNGASVETIEDPDAVGAADNRSVAIPPTDAWLGRWTGPEGLFLDIQPAPDGKAGHYTVANRDSLDRQADYQGVADGATIRFVRDGKDLSIRPGTGAATGFKYLAAKQDCLIVVPNQEGYCR